MIDLHIHSTFSDGSDTPTEIVESAVAKGLAAVALTDHDSMGGAEEFLAACRARNLTGIAGVELSVDTEKLGGGTVHILGYGVNGDCPALSDALQRVLDARDWRNERIVEKLNELGVEVTMAEVQDCAGETVVGRVHIAQALVNRGAVASVEEAFEQYLDESAPAYVTRYKLYPDESIRLIHEAGGAAVFAHPFQWSRDPAEIEEAIQTLKGWGLDGVEVRNACTRPNEVEHLLRCAAANGLFPTGGSDYHGIPKPDIRLGSGFGSLNVPDDYLPPLLAAIGGKSNPCVYLSE